VHQHLHSHPTRRSSDLLQAAANIVQLGQARAVLMVNPEICTGHLNFRDRDSHFIFGDAATAVIVERAGQATSPYQWEIVGTKLRSEEHTSELQSRENLV